MTDIPTLCIKNWERFENAEARRLKRLNWVALPLRLDGLHYRRLVNTEDGIEAYAVFTALLAVAARADKRGALSDDRGKAYTTADLALLTSIPETTIERAIAILSSNAITWLEPLETPSEPLGTPSESPETPSESSAYRTDKTESTGKNKTEHSRSTSSRWDGDEVRAIYAVYPRRVAKPAALKAIAKALDCIADGKNEPPDLAPGQQWPPGSAHAWLLERTERFAKSPAGRAGRFTPHPSTWFSQGRYSDDPDEWNRRSTDDKRTDTAARRAAECPEPELDAADLAFK